MTRGGWLAVGLILLASTGCSGFFSWDVNRASGVRIEEGAQSYYIVAEGDTLYSIAFQAGKDYRQVAKWNGIRWPYRIYPDQRLRLTPSDAKPTVAARAADPRQRQGSTARSSINRRSVNLKKAKPVSRAATSGRSRKAISWQWPVQGPVLSRYANGAPGRKGLDIAGKFGQPVRATADGRVVYSGSGLRGYGKLIIIKHDDVYLSAYGHNRKLLVKEGETLRAGQVIAELGDTGTDRPKLHFEIRRNGEPVDPQKLLPRR